MRREGGIVHVSNAPLLLPICTLVPSFLPAFLPYLLKSVHVLEGGVSLVLCRPLPPSFPPLWWLDTFPAADDATLSLEGLLKVTRVTRL